MTSPYSSVVADRFRHPRRRGTLKDPEAAAEGVNPLCGDRIRIELRLVDRQIEAARYHGDACAICLAAADVLAEAIEGRSIVEARAVTVDRIRESLAAAIGPSRLACVTLPVTTLAEAMDRL